MASHRFAAVLSLAIALWTLHGLMGPVYGTGVESAPLTENESEWDLNEIVFQVGAELNGLEVPTVKTAR